MERPSSGAPALHLPALLALTSGLRRAAPSLPKEDGRSGAEGGSPGSGGGGVQGIGPSLQGAGVWLRSCSPFE